MALAGKSVNIMDAHRRQFNVAQETEKASLNNDIQDEI